MLKRNHLTLCGIVGVFILSFSFFVPSISAAVDEQDPELQENIDDGYVDDAALEETDMEIKEPDKTGVKVPQSIRDLDDIEQETVADPLEPINRVMFDFNDKVYFWAMKPFYKVYNNTLPEELRMNGRNFFDNLAMPVRFVSCAVQIKPKCAGNELVRFGINSTIGMAGLFDMAAGDPFSIKPQEADIGLALGHYGIGEGFYLVLPFMGPYSFRDAVGTVADGYLTPTSYIAPFYWPIAISGGDNINRGSLKYTEYEDLKNAAIDPYAAMKDAYIQYRRGKIK